MKKPLAICIFLPFLFSLPTLVTSLFEQNPETIELNKVEPITPVIEPPASPFCNCNVTQGNFSSPIPFMSSNATAVEFYSYGNPVGASANTGLEMSETMVMMIYEDTNTGNTSLVFILDIGNDGTGGSGSVTLNCMPSGSFVEFSDEPGELTGSPPTFTGNFNWAACCTDGGVIGGFGCGSTITINPNFTSGINDFSLVYGTPTNPIFVNMPQLNCPIVIDCGGSACCEEAFEFEAITTNSSCENTPDGSIDLTTDCASVPTFFWSNGSVTEDLFALTPGDYTVTITDLNGCSAVETYTIAADFPSPQPSITGPDEFCEGELAELGVTGIYSNYLWSNFSTSPTILASTPDTYMVTVTNDDGCTGVASTTLIQNPIPEPEIMGPTGICTFNDTITLDAGTGFETYSWSTGSNAQSIEVTEFGGYFVTVTNDFDCSAFDFILVEPLPNPFPEITGPSSICAGNQIALDVGAGYETYEWSTGDISQVIVATEGGTYTVTVTNADNCEGTASQEIIESPADTLPSFQSSCNPADTGVFISTFTNQFGCDSVEILTVNFSESDEIFLTDESCNPADTGVFVQTFTNQFGCDSIVTETVTLLSEDVEYITDYSCSPLDTGVFVQTFTNQFGCDSIVNTTVLLLPTDTVELFDQSCDPANAGVTEEILVNSFGCDSLVITTTTYSLADTTYINDTSCDPQSIGVSEENLVGTDGCDSIVITTISLLLSDTTYLSENTCDIGQEGYNEELLTNQEGCDSLVITTTTFIPPDTTFEASSSCDPTSVGVFEEILSNSFGCDSFIITTVTLLESDTTELFETSCDPSQSGVEETLLTNQAGCDSLVITTTSFSEADSTQVIETTCDPTQAGVFVEILTSTDGCDSVVTTTVNLLPTDTVEVSAETCDPTNVGISQNTFSNQYGCDSIVITTTELLPSDTTFLQAITCDQSQAGLNEDVLSNQYGCDSLVVTNTTFIPPDTTFFTDETCDPTLAGIEEVVLQNTNGCDSLVITTTTLLPSDTTLLVFESCSPMDTGLVTTLFNNQYGCDSLVLEQTNLLPPSACELEITIVGDTISCDENEGSISIIFSNGTPPIEYTWTHSSGATGTGTINQIGTPQIVNDLDPGDYIFEIMDIDGLSSTLNTSIFQPDPITLDLQIDTDFNGYEISCFGASDGAASVSVQSGGVSPYAISWSTGSDTEQVANLSTGWTSVTVTGSIGCVTTDSVFLESPDELTFEFETTHPDCLVEEFGSISITETTGGTEPYQYSANNDWQAFPFFENLFSGNYDVEVEDANGCSATASTFIDPVNQLVVLLGNDETIQWGDSVTIQAFISPPNAPLENILWSGVDCPNCPIVEVGPLENTIYSVTIVDSLGCTASDDIQVFVEKNFDIYIPNAFSPNFDGINDNFTIFGGPHLSRINQLQIFDRWGEAVFTGFNLPPNDLTYGWDGMHRGEELNPAIFVFFAELEFADGTTQLVEGDIMLTR